MSLTSAFETVKRTADTFGTKAKNVISNIESAVGQYVGSFGTELRNGTMTGVNYSGLGEVNAAIETWLEKIDTDLKALQNQADAQAGAFRGEQFTTAITDFIDAVRETCYNMASNLRDFQKLMNDAIAAYKARDEQMKSEIGSSSEQVKSQSSYYEKVEHSA